MILGMILGICILVFIICAKVLIWIKKKEIEADIYARRLEEYLDEEE